MDTQETPKEKPINDVRLTKAAAEHIRKKLDQRGKGVGMRFGIQVSGCNGFRYVVDFADEIQATDEVFEHFGIQVMVAPKDLDKLAGTVIDFNQQSLLNQGLEFQNPNIKSSCGCGESVGF